MTDPFSMDATVEAPSYKPSRIVVYGTHGVGKTSLLSRFPKPIALFTEEGERSITIRRFPQKAETFGDVCKAINAVLRQPGDRQTFGLDSLDWLEPLIWRETCERLAIPDIESAGYGKGYTKADEVWSEFLQGMDAIRAEGLHIVLLAHHEVTKYEPPDSDPYNRFDLALHKRARAMIHEWADVVGFAYEKTYLVQKEEGAGKSKKTVTRGGALGGRYLALTRTSTHEAKNGYGLPDEIPLTDDSNTADELLGRIAHSFTAHTGTEEGTDV